VQTLRHIHHRFNRLSQGDNAAVPFPPPAPACPAREPLKTFTLGTFEFHHDSHIWSVRAPGHRHTGRPVLFREVHHIFFLVS
jgi:hypothetical protein